ncbi:MAG: hypothetical protein AAF639_22770, partial [Chloroflexota bacterium]
WLIGHTLEKVLGDREVLKQLKILAGKKGMRYKEYRRLKIQLHNGVQAEASGDAIMQAHARRSYGESLCQKEFQVNSNNLDKGDLANGLAELKTALGEFQKMGLENEVEATQELIDCYVGKNTM